jgi:hypothetical protein
VLERHESQFDDERRRLQRKSGRLLTAILDDVDLIVFETRVRATVPKGRRDRRVPMRQLLFGKTKREAIPQVELAATAGRCPCSLARKSSKINAPFVPVPCATIDRLDTR